MSVGCPKSIEFLIKAAFGVAEIFSADERDFPLIDETEKR